LRPLGAAILLILALTSAVSVASTRTVTPLTSTEDTQAGAPQRPQFSTRVTQVEVYATVTDADGRAIEGLAQTDFTVFEDEVPQTITAFAGGSFPAAVALALDRSFSMKGAPLMMARTAGRAFVGALQPLDRAMLISISGKVDILAPLSADKAPVLKAIDSLDAWGTTSLHDALIRSIELLEGQTGRRAIVVISDGQDRYSQARENDVIDRARQSDVLMYPIALGRVRPRLFAELATVTGGRSFHVRDPKELVPTLQTIAKDIRAQYLLGYEPSETWPAEGGEWRSIRVEVSRPGARVRARSGYSSR